MIMVTTTKDWEPKGGAENAHTAIVAIVTIFTADHFQKALTHFEHQYDNVDPLSLQTILFRD